MDRDEFEFHMSLARKCIGIASAMLIVGVLCLIFGHASTKGYIIACAWMTLLVIAIAKGVQVLHIGRRMQASGQITDRRNGS